MDDFVPHQDKLTEGEVKWLAENSGEFVGQLTDLAVKFARRPGSTLRVFYALFAQALESAPPQARYF